MRKSRYVTVLLTATALAACDRPEGLDGTIYGSVADCAKEQSSQVCQQNFEVAKAQHAETAPKFASAEECKAAGYDQCEETKKVNADGTQSSGGGMFMPIMMGYMMGRMMGGGGAVGVPPSAGAKPVFADRSGVLRTNPNTVVGRTTPGATSIGTVRTAARGGFGNVSRGTSAGS